MGALYAVGVGGFTVREVWTCGGGVSRGRWMRRTVRLSGAGAGGTTSAASGMIRIASAAAPCAATDSGRTDQWRRGPTLGQT